MAIERASKRIRPQDFELSQVQDNLGNALDGVLQAVDRGLFRRSIPLGQYWTNGTMPTSYAIMERAIVRGATAANMGARALMPVAGTVLSIQGVANGTPGGTWWLCLAINDKLTSLSCASTGVGNWVKSPRGAINFAVGDVLSIYIRGSSATMQQAFSASVDVEGVLA